MRVVHISYQYGFGNVGGAAVAASRLHDALLEKGVESFYICVRQTSAGRNVIQLPRNGFLRFSHKFLIDALRRIWKITPYRKSIALNVIPLFGLRRLLKRLNPDVVHVHWINDCVMSFGQLAKIDYPVIINLHDFYMINAIDPHPGQDKRYEIGFNKSNSDLISRYVFARKGEAIRRLNPVFVTPSKWGAYIACNSYLAHEYRCFAVSNIVRDEFFLLPFEYREKKKFHVLFVANAGINNPYKGYSDLVHSLELVPAEIKKQMVLIIVGDAEGPSSVSGIETKHVGKVSDIKNLVELYDSADCFAFPSLYETQGLVKVEALLRGCPVVCFNRSACSENVISEVNGWVAPDGDFKAFSRGLSYWFSCWATGTIWDKRRSISQMAREVYSKERILDEILFVYEHAKRGVK